MMAPSAEELDMTMTGVESSEKAEREGERSERTGRERASEPGRGPGVESESDDSVRRSARGKFCAAGRARDARRGPSRAIGDSWSAPPPG